MDIIHGFKKSTFLGKCIDANQGRSITKKGWHFSIHENRSKNQFFTPNCCPTESKDQALLKLVIMA